MLQVVSFPQVAQPKQCMDLSCLPAVCATYLAYPILIVLSTRIIFGEEVDFLEAYNSELMEIPFILFYVSKIVF